MIKTRIRKADNFLKKNEKNVLIIILVAFLGILSITMYALKQPTQTKQDAYRPYYHKACINDTCRDVYGAGPNQCKYGCYNGCGFCTTAYTCPAGTHNPYNGNPAPDCGNQCGPSGCGPAYCCVGN